MILKNLLQKLNKLILDLAFSFLERNSDMRVLDENFLIFVKTFLYSIFVCSFLIKFLFFPFFFSFFFSEENEQHYGANPHPYLFNL